MINDKQLIQEAFKAREKSYSPYSAFQVGAALLTASGKVYQGCNIENAALGPSNCAERTAFFKAISEGERDFISIAVVGGPAGKVAGDLDYTPPCGVCRQVMAEFCDPDRFRILLAKSADDYFSLSLKELLPYSFSLDRD